MAYEYKEVIKEELEYTDLDNADSQVEMVKELDEVYRKAKSFDEIIKTFKDSDLYTNDDVIEIIQEQLDVLEANDET